MIVHRSDYILVTLNQGSFNRKSIQSGYYDVSSIVDGFVNLVIQGKPLFTFWKMLNLGFGLLSEGESGGGQTWK
ncbi:hypothetical protein HUB98_19045 [Paenibacillus barcinonensis]|uniref:Uncharacterized protein n=1 Tax=Paenibacillus barcinonensis TaxID=198119 RepID=A0ABX6Q7G5_PAEBA|nr:hypothetical protein [Paenibacillus barcinonensis]QKS58134.1 hypothetical protein HUB98_19045 [Paenibacillus barcinonensis]